MEIIVTGAGLGGLSAAYCFALRGHVVKVFEHRPTLSARGGSLSTRPGASRVLESWGLKADLETFANRTSKVIMRDLGTGELLNQVMSAGDESEFPHWGTTRRELIELLYKKCEEAGVSVNFGVTVRDVGEEAERGYVALDDGTMIHAHLVLVADGIGSRLRPKVLHDLNCSIEPVVSDITAYVFDLDAASLKSHQDIQSTARLTEEVCANIWMGGPEGIFSVTRFNPKGNCVHMLYHTHEPNLDQEGLWDANGDIEYVQRIFDERKGCCSELAIAARLGTSCDRWRLAELPALPRWTSKGGRLVLLGDSAHAMHPSVGQGLSQIIEDIAVLDELIARSPTPEVEMSKITRDWEAIRKPRVERIQEYSRWNTGNVSKTQQRPAGSVNGQPPTRITSYVDVIPDAKAEFSSREFVKWALNYDAGEEVETYLSLRS